MTKDQWPELQQLLYLRHQKEAQTLAKLNSWEAKLIAKHDELGTGEQQITPEMKSMGQNILWEKWIQQQRSKIIASIATISASKEIEKQKVTKSAQKLHGIDEMCSRKRTTDRISGTQKAHANNLETSVNYRLHILSRDIRN